jgi:arginyl-tRNA--protein-N-Asp/Glu arginylyltransferase
MRPENYEQLLDSGFCLSGNWCYHPLGDRSCCALYAIRLDVTKWQAGTKHIKHRKQMENYLANKRQAEEPQQKRLKETDMMASELSGAVLSGLKQSDVLPKIVWPDSG